MAGPSTRSGKALPTGTVTFLYTDIESSTRRWELDPRSMKAAVERHDEIMREAIEAHGGVVFRTMGDAFCAVFVSAREALAGALAAQRALEAEDWSRYFRSDSPVPPSLGLDVRVRMALHTGHGEVRGGDYVGTPLNRIARLLATGYGSQTLLSQATYDLVRDALPSISPDVSLRDLGKHRLKDLQEMEHVYQVVAPDLQADFPPLKSLDARPNNLPAQWTPFVGRAAEVVEVRGLLLREDVRLVTLLGPGGMGKTRLALQVGAELSDEFQDGVFFIDLAIIAEPGLVVAQIATTLGVRESGGRPLVDSLKEYLQDKRILLLLDNFEQVVDAAPLVASLMAAAPMLKVLATSRAVLHLRGENEYPVPPLSMPRPKPLPPFEVLASYEAVTLFIQRARMVKPEFELTRQNAAAVAEICYSLDGLPLAIELAAARIKLLPPEAMLGRLGSRLKLLTGGARDLPARQQTLRSTIEWSFDLLDEGGQTIFRRLSVFVGGFSLEAAEVVCTAGVELGLAMPDVDVLEGVGALTDNSLLRQLRGNEDGGQEGQEEAEGEGRFGMLEVIREYGLSRLAESNEEAGTRRAHAEYYLALVEEAEPMLSGPDQAMWFRKLEAEHGNIRAALDWSQTTEGEAELGLRIAGALLWFWQTRGYATEGRERLAVLLSRPSARGAQATEARAGALLVAGRLAYLQGDYKAARGHFEENLAIWRGSGDGHKLSHALLAMGSSATGQGDYATARALYEESLLAQEDAANKPYRAMALAGLGEAVLGQGDHEQAAPSIEESLELFRELGNTVGAAFALSMLGYVAEREGRYDEARKLLEESLSMRRELGNKQGVAVCFVGLAEVACAQDLADRAARLLGAAEGLLESAGVRLGMADQARFERAREATLGQLGREAFEAAWAQGRTMSLDEAADYALEDKPLAGGHPVEGASAEC
ncbi:MAG: ATP-binding protein [Chloroflexia bacterium]